MIDLHEEDVVNDKIFYHTTGIKNKNGQYKKNPGPAEKYFTWHSPAYA